MLDAHISSLDKIKIEALNRVKAAPSLKHLEELRVRYLGKKSELNTVLREMKDLTPLEKPILGQRANDTKEALLKAFSRRARTLEEQDIQKQLESEALDVTLPGVRPPQGRLHPITQLIAEIEEIFTSMGFVVEDGPEIEDDYYNFEALNIPSHHPARDMHDTFYLPQNRLLRTHTSPVQIRAMRRHKPPMAVMSIGKVYRVDSDTTHSPMFHQFEAFMVDTDITFGALKGTLDHFIEALFRRPIESRLRPSYFPFTEPSAEMDIKWAVRKEVDGVMTTVDEWLEVLGAGMIHPQVMRNGGLDPQKHTGFAFGAGIERLAMLKYGINNIRLYYENDMRFLEQF